MFCNTAAVLSCAWTADAPKIFIDVIKNECSFKLKVRGDVSGSRRFFPVAL